MECSIPPAGSQPSTLEGPTQSNLNLMKIAYLIVQFDLQERSCRQKNILPLGGIFSNGGDISAHFNSHLRSSQRYDYLVLLKETEKTLVGLLWRPVNECITSSAPGCFQ